MATAEEKRKALLLRNALNDDVRRYKYDELVGESYTKKFEYINHDLKLLRFAMDEVGAVSDCYLLFAVATLGVADPESIRLFLRAMSNKHKELSISDMSEKSRDMVRGRLQALTNNGFLFKHHYFVNSLGLNKKLCQEDMSLYTIHKSSQSFMNMKLDRSTVVLTWIQAKPIYVLEGWASCSYVAGRISQNPGYIEHKQGVFKTAAIGTTNVASILKMQKNDEPDVPVYVGFMYSFRHLNKAIQSEEDYMDACQRLVFLISQFFFYMDSKDHVTRLVMVVEDNPDLVEMTRIIMSSEELVEDYDRILFTGEGLIRNVPKEDTSFKDCFLRIKKTRTKIGFDYLPVEPDFIS